MTITQKPIPKYVIFLKKPIPKYVIFLTALLYLFISRSFNFNGFVEIRFTDSYFPESWVELYFKAWWHVSHVLFSDNKTDRNNNLVLISSSTILYLPFLKSLETVLLNFSDLLLLSVLTYFKTLSLTDQSETFPQAHSLYRMIVI